MVESAPLTPMMEQYEAIRARYPGHLVLFRVGDFFETYGEDAKLLSRELELVLTARSPDSKGERIPMAGVPQHAIETYLGRLVRRGYKVALCDQVEDVRFAKGLVRREVTRVVTPGTVLDERILPGPDHNFLAAVFRPQRGPGGFAAVDITTGELFSGPTPVPGLEGFAEALTAFDPREILVGADEGAEELERWLHREYPHARIETPRPSPPPDDLPEAFRAEGSSPAEAAARLALAVYLHSTQPKVLHFVERVSMGGPATRLRLDAKSLRHLEISQPMDPDSPGSPTLLEVLDETVTSSGRRTLAFWLRNPLADVGEIHRRQSIVDALRARGAWLTVLREELRRVPDLARIGSRLAGRRVRPPDLLGLAQGLRAASRVRDGLKEGSPPVPIDAGVEELRLLEPIAERLERAIQDPPPASVDAGRLFRTGADAEVDRLSDSETSGLSELESLERRERESSGLRSVKVGYNQVFGYYLEVPRNQSALVPPHFERRQTLASSERYTSNELRSLEERILTAREALRSRELEVWEQLLKDLEFAVPALYRLGRRLGEVDVLTTFAAQAQERGYVRPLVDDSRVLQIRDGRHPILDRQLRREFVPNDTELDTDAARLVLLTGPNMSGKSTYMRQVGLLVVMAQVGAYVPARFARIGRVTALFTRMGFTDAIGRGKSSFLVEMSEVAEILRDADDRSLVLLDEVGRGTSTFDGLALAWATLQYLHDRIRCRTIVATHFHQLTSLVDGLSAARNAHLAVLEHENEIVFLRTLVPGSTDRSLGLHVARMAGVPPEVLVESERLLKHLESEGIALPGSRPSSKNRPSRYTQAILLPSPATPDSEFERALAALDLNSLSPLEAHRWLVEWRRRLESRPAREAPP
ncbi:MAG: DNA mismatch repair protein MutS [Thermoplasmata archaeon]|nr:DNA mismatch repair protein MutS [Thermoplasmata archaeon]